MKVTIYSRTPLAAAPWELFKALRKYTLLEVALINEKIKYPDGRIFPYHLMLSHDGAARNWLMGSDVWHVNNYLTPPIQRIKKGNSNIKVLAQFHSIPKLGNWRQLMQFADECYTIKQPLQERAYGFPALPNIIDPDEYRPVRRQQIIKIGFAPTTKLPVGYPASKGYHEVRKILSEMALRKGAEICWIEGKPYLENLKMKSSCHILIDDVVTGNWHRTSLEGACFGCAVINRVNKHPFVFANLQNLKEKLCWLIESQKNLAYIQELTRMWVLQDWHAMDRIQEYTKAYKRLLNAC